MRKHSVLIPLLACLSFSATAQEDVSWNLQKNPTSNKSDDRDPCMVFGRGDESIETAPASCKYSAAYNFPANVNINSCCDIYGDISYIYWYVNQEGLDLATTANANSTSDWNPYPSDKNGFAVLQKFEYTSGFKIGLGANLYTDDWVVDAQYTYVRESTTTSQTAPASDVLTGVFDFTGWFYQTYFAGPVIAQQFNSSWNFGLDWIDLSLKRPYYQGRRLVVTPEIGLRASWIRQDLKVSSTTANIYDSTSGALNNPDVSKNHSHCWAIGPRSLVDAHYLLGYGIRVQGSVGGSLLFTQYTKLSHSETGIPISAASVGAQFSQPNYNCLRPMAEGNLGIGWGMYIYQDQYHVDLSATYDFNYLWNQNMLKYMANLNSVGRGASPYDLVMHGLTLSGRFDF